MSIICCKSNAKRSFIYGQLRSSGHFLVNSFGLKACMSQVFYTFMRQMYVKYYPPKIINSY